MKRQIIFEMILVFSFASFVPVRVFAQRGGRAGGGGGGSFRGGSFPRGGGSSMSGPRGGFSAPAAGRSYGHSAPPSRSFGSVGPSRAGGSRLTQGYSTSRGSTSRGIYNGFRSSNSQTSRTMRNGWSTSSTRIGTASANNGWHHFGASSNAVRGSAIGNDRGSANSRIGFGGGYGGYGRYYGLNRGWGYHGWGWTWFSLFGIGPSPWYWYPNYWQPWYYGAYWNPWFAGWTTTYVSYPYYGSYASGGVDPPCGETGVKFDVGEITDGTDKKVIRESEVTADGGYIGVVKDFDGWSKPVIRLDAGSHDIEVRLPNDQTFTKTVNVQSCEITIVHIPQLPHPASASSAVQPAPQSGNAGSVTAPSAVQPSQPVQPTTDAGQLQQLEQLLQKTMQEDRQVENNINKQIQDLQKKVQ